ncbi:MAG: hypothetical protein A4E39_01012 [Methanoregulaceae archaeon PtaB.Bin152]|nr:MAG: hypothetical protein A4E39_01012 [Methanoregulaceae archaeon PtaB.Bin152]
MMGVSLISSWTWRAKSGGIAASIAVVYPMRAYSYPVLKVVGIENPPAIRWEADFGV